MVSTTMCPRRTMQGVARAWLAFAIDRREPVADGLDGRPLGRGTLDGGCHPWIRKKDGG